MAHAAFPLGVALAAIEMHQPALARAVPIAVGVVVLIRRFPPVHRVEGASRPVDIELYSLYSRLDYIGEVPMPKTAGTGVEEARNRLPKLLDAAERGQTTLITRRGRPVAALIPMEDYVGGRGQKPLLSLAGTGRGLWGKSSSATLDRLRDEWSR